MLEEFDKNHFDSEVKFKAGETQRSSINGLYTLTDYLSYREKYLDIEMYVGDIFNELKKDDDNADEKSFSWGTDRLLPINQLEKSLEDEITIQYYSNLLESLYTPQIYELFRAYFKHDIVFEEEHPTPDKFRLLLEKDYEIKQFIMNFRKDISCYFEHLQKSGNSFCIPFRCLKFRYL